MLRAVGAKLAVTFELPEIVKFWGFTVPLKAPLNPVNRYPVMTGALTMTTAPKL